MKKVVTFLSIAVSLVFLISLSGCVSVDSGISPPVPRNQKGVYHKVQKGETLWRIAKTYGIDIEDLIRSNNIPDGAHLDENQLIFIPGAESVRTVAQGAASSPAALPTAIPANAVKDDFGWPVSGHVVRYFGGQRGSYLNQGIGIETMEGRPVVASRQGKVVFADYLAGFSYTVILDHLDGYFTVYGFNSRLTVNLGQMVAKGSPVALAGRKGNTPLVYFEIRRFARAENPIYFLPKS